MLQSRDLFQNCMERLRRYKEETANKCLNIQADLRKWRTDADTLHIGNKCLWTQSDLRKQAMNGVSSHEFGIGHNLEVCPTGYSQQPNTQQICKGCEVPQPSKPLCLHKWIHCSSFQHANCYCVSLISQRQLLEVIKDTVLAQLAYKFPSQVLGGMYEINTALVEQPSAA